jgi:hypothetical protein
VPAEGAPTSTPYVPPGTQVQAGGTSTLKVVLVIVGVLIGLGILAIALFSFTFWRIAHTVHRSADGFTVSTPNGTVSMQSSSSAAPADLGVPVYPGAVRGEGGMQIRSPKSEIISAIYSTPDPTDKVVEFYKNSLPGDATTRITGSKAVLTAGDKDKETWMIGVDTDPSDTSKTKITIMHVKKF